MKKTIARAAVAAGLAFGMALTAVPAFAAGSNLAVKSDNIRIWGPTRAATSVESVRALEGDSKFVNEAKEVFLVGGNAFSDPLALTTLSACTHSPVLMTNSATDLSKNVADKIKKINPQRVTVVGGPLSVSEDVRDQVRELVPDALVARVSGETRYDTTADVAAYTSDCYAGSYNTNLRTKRDDVEKIASAERAYQKALKDYEATRSAFASEMDKSAAIQKQIDGVNDSIQDQSKKLKDVGDVKSKKDAATKAGQAHEKANEELETATKHRTLLSEKLSNFGKANSTLNIKSTLKDYQDFLAKQPKSAEQQKLINDLKNAVKYLGFNGSESSTSMEKALATANQKEADAKAALEENNNKLAGVVAALLDALDNQDANKSVQRTLQDLFHQLKKLNKQAKDQDAAVKVASDKMAKAQAALVGAVAERPEPGEYAEYQKQLRKAMDDALAKSGQRTVFLANGQDFPDALVGGPAAYVTRGIVLLTDGASLPAATDKVLKAAHNNVVTVGVPAANAVKGDRVLTIKEQFSGNTRYDTAAAITKYYFGLKADANHEAKLNAHPMAIASGEQFADAVLASNFIAHYEGGVLLTQKNEVPTATLNYLNNFSKKNLAIRAFGGPLWLSDSVMATLVTYTK